MSPTIVLIKNIELNKYCNMVWYLLYDYLKKQQIQQNKTSFNKILNNKVK